MGQSDRYYAAAAAAAFIGQTKQGIRAKAQKIFLFFPIFRSLRDAVK